MGWALVSRSTSLAALLIFASRVAGFAQAAVPASSSPQPSAAQASSPTASEEEQAAGPQLPSTQQLDEMFKQAPLGKAADEARLHVQWRDLSNRIVNEPDLIAARAHAEAAITDLEKRQRLRAYYNRYFDRMRSRASSPELKDFIDARKAEQIALLAQDRVRPGSTPAVPKPAPTAPPKGKHKKLRAVQEPALPQ